MGIKKNNKIPKICTNCFNPIYLKFNFSYLVYDENFKEEYKLQFLQRIMELSDVPYTIILNRPKNISFEFEDKDKLNIKKQIPNKFNERFEEKQYNNKLAIMRLYTNNNPIVGRIIGVIIKNIFYIFFIDIGGNLYEH